MFGSLQPYDDVCDIKVASNPDDDPPKSALYDSLTTNIPHPIMAYDSLLFPPETPLFPTASVVLTYLRTYATCNNLRPYIRFNCQVIETVWKRNSWRVELSEDNRTQFIEADRLFIAT